MRRISVWLLFLVSFPCLCPVISYEVYGPPKIVHEALKKMTYRSGVKKAVKELLRESPLRGKKNTELLEGALTKIEGFYGRARGHDILRVVYLSQVVCRVYGIMYFENGPAYFYIDSYNSSDEWRVVDISLAMRPQEILPRELYE